MPNRPAEPLHDPARPEPPPDGLHCPACGGPLEREHRNLLERGISLLLSVHRYRCPSVGCRWQGVLGRDGAKAARPSTRHTLLWLVVGAVTAVTVTEGGRALLRLRHASAPSAEAPGGRPPGSELQSHYTPPGVDFPGTELAATDARVRANPSPLRLRQSCAWGVPGANPYRGTVAQALAAAHLPEAVVRQVAEKAERGWVADQVEISRHGIRSVAGRVDFNANIKAMAFGDTLCFNTRVNFPAGHVEYAALYEADDGRGRTYRVMVPHVCRNVSVLGERHEIEDRPNGRTPSPVTWALVLTGLAALAWTRRPARRQRQ